MKSSFKVHWVTYLTCDHGDAGGDDGDDDDGACSALLSQTPYSRGLGRSCALLVRQLPCQGSLAASCYPGTSGTRLESSLNV